MIYKIMLSSEHQILVMFSMRFKSFPILKKLWHDPVWSKVIATLLIALGALLWSIAGPGSTPSNKTPLGEMPRLAASSPHYPPINLEVIKNLTYRLDGEQITLNDGKRVFNPNADSDSAPHEKTIAAYLTDYAFGDLNGDGSQDAVAILQVTGGGSGIYYYLALVFNELGVPVVTGPALVLGDRLDFRNITASVGQVDIELMLHGPGDPLCCPSVFRHLKFLVRNKVFECTGEYCSEI